MTTRGRDWGPTLQITGRRCLTKWRVFLLFEGSFCWRRWSEWWCENNHFWRRIFFHCLLMVSAMMFLQILFSSCLMQRQQGFWCRWLEWILTKCRLRTMSVKMQVSLELRFCRRVSRDFLNKTLAYLGWCLCCRERKGQRNWRHDSCCHFSSVLFSRRLFQRRHEKREEETGITMCNKSESETLLLTSSLFFIFVLFFLFWSVSSNNRLSVTSCVATTETEEANRENDSKKEGGSVENAINSFPDQF